jgi:hypothetical protein
MKSEIEFAAKFLSEQVDKISFGEVSVKLIIHRKGNIARIEKTICEKTQTGEAK